jgi:hypothetical protein
MRQAIPLSLKGGGVRLGYHGWERSITRGNVTSSLTGAVIHGGTSTWPLAVLADLPRAGLEVRLLGDRDARQRADAAAS